MIKISLSEAKDRLSSLVKEAAETTEPVVISVHGRSEVVMLSMSEYDSLLETIEILKDQALVKKITSSLKEIKRGDLVDFDKIKRDA